MVHSACPATPGAGQAPTRPEVAEVFRRYGPSYLRRRVVLAPEQGRVLRSVIRCRTAALGGHLDVCDHCGAAWHHYNSCVNRHCPTCQGWQAVKWTTDRLERFIDTHHFHVVATVPQELRPVALANQRLVYDLLFQAVSETLLELALDRWDAIPPSPPSSTHGRGRWPTTPHPLHRQRRWPLDRRPVLGLLPPGFLFPVKVLSALIRGKFMARFTRAYEKGELLFVGSSAHLADPESSPPCGAGSTTPPGWSTRSRRSATSTASSATCPSTPTASRSRPPA
ncbi:MAG: transposase zinc-binding domain-containing protein [Alphaproteobacteria bacterium]|nr:transposase zinc-binding domain-containing protein [Alphaproteobacteria bacterium]